METTYIDAPFYECRLNPDMRRSREHMKKLSALMITALILFWTMNVYAESTIQRLPAYAYSGDDPIAAAIADYIAGKSDDYLLEEGSISIPVPVVFKIENTDETHVSAHGNFWLFNYMLQGTTLKKTSGGVYTGILYLEKNDELWTVIDMATARDGTYYGKDIASFSNGDNELEKQYTSSLDVDKEPTKSICIQYILDYVKAHELDIDSYQDADWPVVMLDSLQCN